MINKILEEHDDEAFLKADGFDKVIIGLVEDFNAPPRLAYSVKKCIRILVSDYGMSMEEAVEYFEFNISGAYVGKKTPVWVHDYK